MRKIVYLSFVLVFTACVGFQPATLSEDVPLAHQDSATMNAPSKPILSYKEGVLLNASTDLSQWESSHGNLTLSKKAGFFVVGLTNVGPDWEQLSRKFEPMDFSEAPFLLVKARVEVGNADSLKMRIDLIDEDGNATNLSPQERFVRARSESKLYKFIYAGNWVQNWPTKAEVNAKRIVEIKINFNGGGPKYSGKLIIEEIVVSNGVKKNTNPQNYALFDFSDGNSGWWSANNIQLSSDEVDGRDVLKLKLDSAGPGWEGLGYRLDKGIDFSVTPIVMLRMKASKEGKLRMDINDAKDISTNASPAVVSFANSEGFKEYYFDFRGKFTQSWPTTKVVDSTQIKSIKFHINPPPDNPAFTGDLYIDDITLLSVVEYEKLIK